MELLQCPCQEDDAFTPIFAHCTCIPCRQAIYTSKELRDQMQMLDREAVQLRAQAGVIQLELFIRERRRTQTDTSGNPVDTTKRDFWRGVKKSPMGNRINQKRDLKQEARDMLAGLLD